MSNNMLTVCPFFGNKMSIKIYCWFFFLLLYRYYISKGAIVDQLGGDLNSTPLHWATRWGKVLGFSFVLFLTWYLLLIDLYSCYILWEYLHRNELNHWWQGTLWMWYVWATRAFSTWFDFCLISFCCRGILLWRENKIKLESVVTLLYSYCEDLCFISFLKISVCPSGAWVDFVWRCPCNFLVCV